MIRKVLYSSLILFSLSNVLFGNITHQYRETSEEQTTTINWVEQTHHGVRQFTLQINNIQQQFSGKRYTTKWDLKNTQNKTQLTVEKQDKQLICKGTLNGKDIDQIITLTQQHWIASPGFYLKDFILSKQHTMTFVTLSRTDLSQTDMIVTKLKTETIKINQINYKTIKVEMKPLGYKGLFWKAYYWFDTQSGLFVQYKGKKGPPGTPDFLIEYLGQVKP